MQTTVFEQDWKPAPKGMALEYSARLTARNHAHLAPMAQGRRYH
jgi:hypothetical protein